MWPAAIFSYTQYNNIQCALPMLTDAYGLYYNVDLLSKAGFSEPPKTLSEFTAMAEKLTEYNPDGSIKVAGFMPLFGAYQNTVNTFGHAYAGQWYDSSGKPSLSTDPNWTKMLEWQKSIVDKIGYDKLQKFFGARRRGLRMVRPARLRDRQDRHDARRRVAQRLHRGRQGQDQLQDRPVPGRRRPA